MSRIPHALGCLGCRAHLSVWREEGAFYTERFSGFFPLYFPLFISVRSACLLGAWGLMAGLSGFASHLCSLHLGDGCQ